MGDVLDDPDCIREVDVQAELATLEAQLQAEGIFHGVPPGIAESEFETNVPGLIAYLDTFDFGEVIDLSDLAAPVDNSAPDPAADRLQFTIATMVRSHDHLSLKGERTARKKLERMLTLYQRKCLVLTGCFTEKGPSGVNYLFRHARPIIAFAFPPLRPLCALCVHPLGYYKGTWTGGMVPSDDTIAALLFIRAGEEKTLWNEATHHRLSSLLAGF